ncbi:THAP9 [Mytilus coruscus]|uniref:THAP9 n=1 Tax=Mytilus coruscus TaxID=42192 RepID=A0A6J8C2G3_MYTCO|nr:THAP9 [Mytilus coruscus]
MPKLRKRRDVPSQRKRKKVLSTDLHNDHSYSMPNEAIVQLCLKEEVEVHGERIDPDFTMYTAEPVEDIECTSYEEVAIEDTECVTVSYTKCVNPFDKLKQDVVQSGCISSPYVLDTTSDSIKIMLLYPSAERISVKLNVMINRDFFAKVFVHRIQLSQDHDLWIGLPRVFGSVKDIQTLLLKLQSYSVCTGNFEADLMASIPVGTSVENAEGSANSQGFREGDFEAVKGTISYSSTVRSMNCSLLVQGNRCSPCSQLRRVLISRKHRREEKERKSKENIPNYLHSTIGHTKMSRHELITKIHQQKDKITTLQSEIDKTQRKFQREVSSRGVTLDFCQSLEMQDTMAACSTEIMKAFPDANSYQRLFWAEQQKSTNVKSLKGMRWHPMILRWCLYLRHKSSAAYEALRDSGFITLPSSRTLFDYSHYTKSDNGFLPDVVKELKNEASKREMYSTVDPWKNYVGLLFDEIKVKSDLVYDKHSGELIGYCNLDKVGNQIMNFERIMKDTSTTETDADIAKYMLVLMVRGVATDLKFPLAGFATLSITADFLYPIIWKAIRILETGFAQLKVLFLTCDGASANRKFFNIHGQVNEFIHYTNNPYADDERKLYFISDVPHLVKTTRNCFSNSYSHKNTRKMWKDGKDISWMHLLKLFEDHCELSLYSPCPKLTRSHLDMTTYGCMKVNIAAQVLSSTVANALEMMYGDNVTETVNFIRIMNKFFDCLNVRNLYEGRNKRNPDLEPYTTVNDERLHWLRVDFIKYFDSWEQSVMQRAGNFTRKQRKGMLLSHQTLTGFKISVFSIVDCVKFLLESGAKFVLTHHFNQDPLEQHFGHYRHRVGDNNNPTVNDVRHMMTSMRAVGAQALAPKRGNVSNQRDRNFVIDNTSLPKRRTY